MIENLPNEVIRCAFWFYKRFTASSRFDNLICDIIVDRLQATYSINFLKDGIIIITLTISSDDIRYCSFESICKQLENDFNNL